MRFVFSIFACLLCWGCFLSPKKPSKPIVLVTLPPYANFAKTLVADHALVEIFIPPGANPHTYEPSPEQIKHFTQATVWFRTGDPIEQKMVPFLKQNSVEIINLSKDWITDSSHDHNHDEKDLHLWMNPKIVLQQVEVMSKVLSKKFSNIASSIQENYQRLSQQLEKMDQNITTAITPFQGSYILISHPALGYFCERYGLHQLSIEVEGKDPLPQDIARLMSQLQAHPVPVVFIAPQYNNKGALLIAHKLHLPFETIDPYAENYFDMLTHLTDLIVKYYGHPNS